jgi:hypothetical protein
MGVTWWDSHGSGVDGKWEYPQLPTSGVGVPWEFLVSKNKVTSPVTCIFYAVFNCISKYSAYDLHIQLRFKNTVGIGSEEDDLISYS